jgi:hypothetical protein
VIRLFLIIAAVWLIALPPFFTDGACTAEFNRVALQIDEAKPQLTSPASAKTYFTSGQVPFQVISAERCRVSKPRDIDRCGPGDLVRAAIPVKNLVCRIYRDSTIRVDLQFDERGRLRQLQTQMDPFKYFSVPWTGVKVYWGI